MCVSLAVWCSDVVCFVGMVGALMLFVLWVWCMVPRFWIRYLICVQAYIFEEELYCDGL
jgi:hypothetical protein